ncbi:MAG: hypothetical protein M0C28_24455 [Candidatus Moduliflexus flocculans]|nr:hypothetical protein [Candidatus Moduliflexus flocculans]
MRAQIEEQVRRSRSGSTNLTPVADQAVPETDKTPGCSSVSTDLDRADHGADRSAGRSTTVTFNFGKSTIIQLVEGERDVLDDRPRSPSHGRALALHGGGGPPDRRSGSARA